MTAYTKNQVVKNILNSAIGEGVGISTILRQSSVSYHTAMEYLYELIDEEVIERVDYPGRPLYRTTSVGIGYLSDLMI
jgi:predicted transcriptional regulator